MAYFGGLNLRLKIVGVLGHFAENTELNDGQTNKTRIVFAELKRHINDADVCAADSYKWKQNPLKLFGNCLKLVGTCRNIIIFPAHNGLKVFVPMLCFFNLFYKRKLHYVVIGGWLPEFLEKHRLIGHLLKFFYCIYVETNSMKLKLEGMGYDNVCVMPNFKHLTCLKPEDLVYQAEEPFAFCTFSRVMREKGIEDAVQAVTAINEEAGRTCCTLDIFGQTDQNYAAQFWEMQKHFPKYIQYRGVVSADKSVETLKHYFALLFPTHFQLEGLAGTLLDAFFSGTPIITTNWKHSREFIESFSEGLIYPNEEMDNLENAMKWAMKNKDAFLAMKKQCLSAAEQFKPDKVIQALLNNL